MGVIRDLATGRTFPLAARNLIGRASQCHIRLEASFVSREHASVEFLDGRYYIKDLSSNGIEVEGRLVERGELTALKLGVRVALGCGVAAPALQLQDDGPPQLVAHELDSARVLGVPRGSVLCLPCESSGAANSAGDVQIGFDEQLGAFMFTGSISDSVSPIRNEQILRVGSSLWMVHLPSDENRTATAGRFPIDLRHATLKLVTDEAMEMVEVRLRAHLDEAQAIRGAERVIVSRSRYAETLLALALKKRDDLAVGVPEQNAGWLTNEALVQLVGTSPGSDGNLPYLHPFRLRRLFEAANVRSSSLLIQRERGSLRLGVRDFEILMAEDASELSHGGAGRARE